MPLIYLVRHGRIADVPANPLDPELGEQGLEQARTAARELQARLPHPLPILTSPMRRCRQTAAPLAELWQTVPVVEPRVIEVPAPRQPGLQREQWLKRLLAADWTQADEGDNGAVVAAWRQGVREAILACAGDTVIFTHFVPINVIAGLALGQDSVCCFRPDNGSVTVVEVSADGVRLVERGREVQTRVV
ncbi:MAG: histidine phosphatase family protein [Nevskiales bacterium]